jgi:hypothetical protein
VVKTMLLSKLRAAVAVGVVIFVSGGVTGLAYRTTAAEPSKAAAPGAAQPAADDLEALRLEVEAPRRSLHATRERVKALEDEVGASREREAAAPKKDGAPANTPADAAYKHAVNVSHSILKGRPGPADALAEAEAALKKLKEHPDDKQATEVLEKALQRLKERAKPPRQEENLAK